MFEEKVIEELRLRLETEGSTNFADAKGRRLYLIRTKLLHMPFDGLLIAYEGCGAMTFELDRPLNKFRLIQSGFGFDVAETLAGLVNRVTRVTAPPALKGASNQTAKALSGPKKEKIT